MKKEIKDFLESDKRQFKFKNMLPISDINDILKELSFSDLQRNLVGDETNGWQIDFWYKFVSEKYGNLTLSGSLHYGDFTLDKK